MKKKTLLLTAAMAVTSLTASAQYVYRDELPIVEATEATDVDDYGFYANWKPLTDDQLTAEAKVLGYYVKVFAAKQGKAAGDKFYYINTDFSFIKSEYTVDNPYTAVDASNNTFLQASLNEPYRPGAWTVVNAGQADGVLTLDCKLNKSVCNGTLVLNYTDLSKGNGKVHFRFKVRSNGKAKTLGVHMRDITKFPNEDVDSYIVEDITTEWKQVECTLNNGPEQGDIVIYGEDTGNLSNMFLFIDDLQIWTELNEGEVAYVTYSENFLKDDVEASSLYFSTGDVYEGEGLAYTAHAYNLEGISYPSNMVSVGDATGITVPETDVVDATTPVTVYNLSGSVVARGTVGNMPAMPKGVLIIKTGDNAKKVLVK